MMVGGSPNGMLCEFDIGVVLLTAGTEEKFRDGILILVCKQYETCKFPGFREYLAAVRIAQSWCYFKNLSRQAMTSF
jgi:hypothetical protein